MTNSISSRNQADRADQTRARILEAATREFSANGLAGARTERIAEAAGVNKALLYYYFRSKDALYAAALEEVATCIAVMSLSVLNLDCSPGERLLRWALNHFDRIYSQPVFQTLLQQEMIRLRKGETADESPLVNKLFRPMADQTLALAEKGIRSGELIAVESSQLMYAIIGPNVFYFLSAPMMRVIANTDVDVLDASTLAFRRRAAVEYLGQAIFTDREAGARIAARVLADTPMPSVSTSTQHEFRGLLEIQRQSILTSNIEDSQTSSSEVRKK